VSVFFLPSLVQIAIDLNIYLFHCLAASEQHSTTCIIGETNTERLWRWYLQLLLHGS